MSCVIIFAVFFAFRTKELLSGHNATMFTTKVRLEEGKSFDLLDLGHYFAIEKIPEDVATVTLETSVVENDGKVRSTEIIFSDCTAAYSTDSEKTKRLKEMLGVASTTSS